MCYSPSKRFQLTNFWLVHGSIWTRWLKNIDCVITVQIFRVPTFSCFTFHRVRTCRRFGQFGQLPVCSLLSVGASSSYFSGQDTPRRLKQSSIFFLRATWSCSWKFMVTSFRWVFSFFSFLNSLLVLRIHTHTCTHACKHAQAHTHTHTHTHTCARTHAHTHTHTHTHTHVHTHTQAHVLTHTGPDTTHTHIFLRNTPHK